MSKIVLLLLLLFGFLFIYPQIHGEVKADVTVSILPGKLTNKDSSGVDITISGLVTDKEYIVRIKKTSGAEYNLITKQKPNSDGTFSFHLCSTGSATAPLYKITNDCQNKTFNEGVYNILIYEYTGSPNQKFLKDNYFKVIVETKGTITILNKDNEFTTSNEIVIWVNEINDGSYKILVDRRDPNKGGPCMDARNGGFIVNLGQYYEKTHTIEIYTNQTSIGHPFCGAGSLVTYRQFTIDNEGPGGPGPGIGTGTTSPISIITGKNCKSEDDPKFDDRFDMVCALSGGIPCGTADNPAFATAIGCIHTSPAELVKDFMTFVIGISGGLAFLMMLLGAFQMLTSAGNPETLNAGKDRITSAVIGLLFVIFSILLLQIIGVDILKIPEFGR